MDRPDQPRPLPLSKRLAQILKEASVERFSFTQLASKLQSTAWGGLLLIFAAINVLPLPPGTSVFFAIPLMIVSAQMAIHPWQAQTKNEGVNINVDPARIAYGVMTGIGFLGAGVIVHQKGAVRMAPNDRESHKALHGLRAKMN